MCVLYYINKKYVFKLRVEDGIVVSDDQLFFMPIADQMTESFAEVA